MKVKFFAFFVFLFVLSFGGSVFAAAPAISDDVKNFPPLLRYQASQVGDGDVFLILYGTKLPTPTILHADGTDDIKIVFKNSFNAIKETISDTPELPLITEISFSQEGNDAVIYLQTHGTLALKDISGVGPANRFHVTFESQEKIDRMGNQRVVLDKRLAPPQSVPAFLSRQLVTLDLRDVVLSDVARMLGNLVKKNIVVDKSMPADLVTMVLKDVPLNEVVEYLKRMYDIDFAMMGEKTIIAGARDGLSRLSGREITKSFHIAYADVAKIGDILSGVMELKEDERRKIIPDERLRQIYVTASPERLEEISIALQRIDAPGRQVMLHARVLEFNNDDSYAVSTVINAIYDNWWFMVNGGAGKGGVIDAGKRGGLVFPKPEAPINDIINGTTRMIDASLSATQSKGKGKVLANPSVITIDGMPASVNLTQERPYRVQQNATGGVTYTTEKSTAGPKLVMTPKIGRDGIITIDLDLDASEFIGLTEDGDPIKSSRQVKTNVRVRNGEPFVVGGLHSEYTSKVKSKIPILGDIPLIGFLFSKVTNKKNDTQVVMLVVPYILDTPDSEVETAPLPFRR